MFRSSKLPLNSRQHAGTELGNNLVMDDCDPRMGRLRRADSWMDRAKHKKESEGREKERKEQGKLGIQRLTPTFHLPSGRAEAQGNNKRLLQPFSLFPGYREVKPSKNSVTIFLCVCVCVCGGERKQSTCIMISINLHTPEGWRRRFTVHLAWNKYHVEDFYGYCIELAGAGLIVESILIRV